MSRTMVNFWLDTLLLLIFVSLVWVNLIVRFVFPPALQSTGWTLWGLGYEQWINAQFALTSVMSAAVLLHVMLHWTWVCGIITSRLWRGADGKRQWSDGERTLLGVGLLVVIMFITGIPLAAAMFTVQNP